MDRSFPFPLPRLSRPSASALTEGPVSSMLAQADDYATKHKENYRDQIDRYRQVFTQARGTADEDVVNQRLEAVVNKHQTALRQAIKDFETRMNEKLRAGKPQEAYEVWKTFPDNLRTREGDQQIQQLLKRSLPSGFMPMRSLQ